MFYKILHYGQKKCSCGKHKIINRIVRRILRIFYSCNIGLEAQIAPSVRFSHYALGVVIHDLAVIGDNTQIEVNVVIGEKEKNCVPIIGKNCRIGAGAVIIGKIVIGDNCQIGANAVVTHDIPANSVAVGIPARVIKQLDK